MTALDHENERNLINPYIQISKCSGNGLHCFLNASTFGDCQEELIHPLDRQTVLLEGKKQLYVVEAIVGEYNGSPVHSNLPMLKTVSLIRHERSRTLLGYLEEDVIKKYLPNTFITLNR